MSAQRPWAYPFVPVYAAGLAIENALRRPPKSLSRPVLSVGSLSAGGAGKTPVVIALAKLLAQEGKTVDVLTRGYGRKGNAVEAVDTTVPDAASRFGDEPVLIAQCTGVPVWVSGDRFTAGHYAEQRTKPDIHILDDGFQHRRLSRAVDLVLFTAEDLADTLLPAGNLREPFSALRRASAVVVRAHERERVIPRLKPHLVPNTPIWIIRRQLRFASPLAMLGAGLRPLAFCALARPADFSAMVQAAGCGLVDTLCFRDHHPYENTDIDTILATAKKLNITGFVTTEKDAVKLTPAMRERLAAVGPLLIAELEVTFGDPQLVLRFLEEHLR